jgi:TPR repeat protein
MADDVGDVIAQNRLARILATGRGAKADPLAAAKYHYLAKNAGKEVVETAEEPAGRGLRRC